MKRCRECDIELVAGENWYPSCAKKNDCRCKGCISERSRQYYKENSEAAKARARKWALANPEKVKAAQKRFHEVHPERKKEASDRYCKANAERLNEQSRQRYRDNPEKALALQAKYRRENPEKRRESCARYRKAHPEKARQYKHRRRARKLNATIGPVDELAVYELYESTCLYCGATDNLTIDHAVPLAGGGSHCQDNLVVACGRCNYSKGPKPLEVWLQTQPRANVWVY